MVEIVDSSPNPEPTPEVGGDTYISRAAYTDYALAAGLHKNQIDGSWHYLVNDFIYAKKPSMRAAYEGGQLEGYRRYRERLPIAVEFANHPDFGHDWRDGESVEVDGLDLKSLAEYLRHAFSEAAARKLPVEKFLGRRCRPGWVAFWQRLAEGFEPGTEPSLEAL